MNKRELPEIRCPYCNKLIAKGEAAELELRCGRCKSFFILRATRPDAELHEGRRSFSYGSDNVQGIPAHAGIQRLQV